MLPDPMAGPGRKHLLIEVPDHQPLPASATTTSTQTSPTQTPNYSTFLRLGTPDGDPPMKAILEQIVSEGFIDDTRDRGPNHVAGKQASITSSTGNDAGPGHTLDVSARQVTVAGKTTAFSGPVVTVRLDPGAGSRIEFKMTRYANRPTLAFPWDRGWYPAKCGAAKAQSRASFMPANAGSLAMPSSRWGSPRVCAPSKAY